MNWFDVVALEEYEELSLLEKVAIMVLFNFIMLTAPYVLDD